MAYVCKGFCEKYKFNAEGNGWYKSGAKRCIECQIYLTIESNRCPCCGCTLRLRARNARIRRENKKKVEYVRI